MKRKAEFYPEEELRSGTSSDLGNKFKKIGKLIEKISEKSIGMCDESDEEENYEPDTDTDDDDEEEEESDEDHMEEETDDEESEWESEETDDDDDAEHYYVQIYVH